MVERVMMEDGRNGTKSGRVKAAGRYLRGEISLSGYEAIRAKEGLSSSECVRQDLAPRDVDCVQRPV